LSLEAKLRDRKIKWNSKMKGERKIHKHRFLSQGTGGNEEKQTKKA
jgi:hypothetical protein